MRGDDTMLGDDAMQRGDTVQRMILHKEVML